MIERMLEFEMMKQNTKKALLTNPWIPGKDPVRECDQESGSFSRILKLISGELVSTDVCT